MTYRNRRRATALLAAAPSLAVASPAWAADVLFSTHRDIVVGAGERVEQATGLTQIRLDSGAVSVEVDVRPEFDLPEVDGRTIGDARDGFLAHQLHGHARPGRIGDDELPSIAILSSRSTK